MIHTFRETGEHISTIFYDTPMNTLKLSWVPQKKNFDLLKKPKYYSECVGMAVDSKERIFIIITARLPEENEKTSIVFVDGKIRYKPKYKKYPKETDLYWLLVFNRVGKIIAVKPLDIFCSGLYVHNNHLFIVDKIFEKVIHEYRYTFESL